MEDGKEDWKSGRLTRIFWIIGLCQDKREDWKSGRVEGWKMGEWKEDWKIGRKEEDWKMGRKIGRVEDWKEGVCKNGDGVY